jgi:hypothetical protein
LQTGISIRHADTVDVKFIISTDGLAPEEKVIALPHAALLALTAENGRKLTDAYCRQLAAAHLRYMIETAEDMDKTLVTLSPEEVRACDERLHAAAVSR